MRAVGVIGAVFLLGGMLTAVSAAAEPPRACDGTRIDASASLAADRLYGSWFVTQGTGTPLGQGERLHFEPGEQVQQIDVTTRNRPDVGHGEQRSAALRLLDPWQNVYRASYGAGVRGEWKFLNADTYNTAVIVAECAPGVDRILLLTATRSMTELQRSFAEDWWNNHELEPTAVAQPDAPF